MSAIVLSIEVPSPLDRARDRVDEARRLLVPGRRMRRDLQAARVRLADAVVMIDREIGRLDSMDVRARKAGL